MTKIKQMWEWLSSAIGFESKTPEKEHIQIDESYTAYVKPNPNPSNLGEFFNVGCIETWANRTTFHPQGANAANTLKEIIGATRM